MVSTPWYDAPIPMTQAAELGTKKVMQEHCSIGLVVTTDGSVTDIDRQDYIQAEKRAIEDMAATGKPFLVIVNTKNRPVDVKLSFKGRLCENLLRYGVRMRDDETSAELKPYGYLIIRISQ